MAIGVTEADLPHLRRCVQLATEAVEAGDFPFGSVLIAADGTVLVEDRNREVTAGDPTRHPEFAIACWAATNMTPRERATATVYTSGGALPDVRRRTRLGRAGAHRVRDLHRRFRSA